MMRVVAIVGCGRSGSTFLDMVLGSHPDICSVGEVSKYIAAEWGVERTCACGQPSDECPRISESRCRQRRRTCACGQPSDECPFWNSVRGIWESKVDGDGRESYPGLERLFTRARRWPRLLREARRPSPEFRTYARCTKALYEAIGEASGRPVVVDSSKTPVRGFALSQMPDIDIRMIHLVRDARGVAWSHIRRSKSRPDGSHSAPSRTSSTWKIAVDWDVLNVQAAWMGRRMPHGTFVTLRYEDVVADPVSSLERAGRTIGCDLSVVSSGLVSGGEVSVGHVIGGNRLRMSQRFSLRPDVSWSGAMPLRDRRIAWLVSGPLLRRYAYEK